MRYLLLLLFSIVFITSRLCATEVVNNQDTIQLKKADWNLKFSPLSFSKLDGFQNYRSELADIPYLRIGNLGLAARRFDTINTMYGVNSILGDYLPYFKNKSNIKFYQTKRPFTSLHYINGAESEQYFRLLHTQNFSENGNFSFAYNRITSEGFFVDQFTNHINLLTNYYLQSNNGRFSSKAFFSLNVLEAQENGGIVLAPNEDPGDNTILLNVNLNEAQSKLRGQYLNGENSIKLFGNDSSLIKNMHVFHEFAWSKNSRKYEDLTASNVTFYKNEYFDLVNTRDTTFIQELTNKFGFSFLNRSVSISYEIRDMDFFQNYIIDRQTNSNYAHINYSDSLLDGSILLEYKLGISGFHQNENFIKAAYASNYKTINYEVLFQNQLQRANPLMSKHRTNHFFYDLNLDLIHSQKVQLTISHKKSNSKLNLAHESIKNHYYFDSTGLPNQFSKRIDLLRLTMQKKFEFLKHFNLLNIINYQSFSDETILPLPKLSSRHSFYYENIFFKESLGFQIGVDYAYVAPSIGYRYNPALATFHLSNEDEKLPSIHQLDIFMNLGITKAAKLFVKMENVLLPTFSEDSYLVHDQPIPGRALKFGLYWRMIN